MMIGRMRDIVCYWLVMRAVDPCSPLGMRLLPYAGNHAYRESAA
jgi:hypothetical protein